LGSGQEKFEINGHAIWKYGCEASLPQGSSSNTYQATEELAESPPDGEDGEEPLVRGWDELYSNYVKDLGEDRWTLRTVT
jgi:hypothetical protein